jgi:hypothetical protein
LFFAFFSPYAVDFNNVSLLVTFSLSPSHSLQ